VVRIISSLFFLLICEILFIFPGGIVFEILTVKVPTLNENLVYLIAFLFSALALIFCLRAFFPEIYLRIIDLLRVNKFSICLFTALFILSGLLYSIIVIVGINFELIGPKSSMVEDTGLLNVLFLLLLAIFGSAVEEVFFRGAALSFLLQRLKPWISIVLISIVFSLGHMQYAGIMPYISAFIFGVLASILVIKTNSLYWAIGIHSGWNFAYGMCSLYFDLSVKSIPNWGKTFELLEVGLLLIMLSSILIYSRTQGFLKPVNEQNNLTKC